MKLLKARTGNLNHSISNLQRTTGFSKGRETYEDGASIVVVGVTTYQGAGENLVQGEVRQVTRRLSQRIGRYANA